MQPDWDKKLFEKHAIEAPSHIPHYTDEEREKFKVKAHHSWKQRGNQLYCKCELGIHTSYIPTNKLLQGMDSKGMPIFCDIDV